MLRKASLPHLLYTHGALWLLQSNLFPPKSTVFLYDGNQQSENEIKETIPRTMRFLILIFFSVSLMEAVNP